MELRAFRAYAEADFPVRYWRTKSGLEVDFILGDGEVAIEVKGSALVRNTELRGLRAFCDEHHPKRAIVASNEPSPRRTGDFDNLPWRVFLDQLWSGQILSPGQPPSP